MREYIEAFTLGNAAIAGNVCMLPLYPGLFAMFTGQGGTGARTAALKWMGVLVMAGVVTAMVTIGFVLYQLGHAVADILDWLLPVMYAVVGLLGVAMIAGRNPFTRLATSEAPILRSPLGTAFVYGMMLGPMTLPCTGPLIISAFVIGGVAGTSALVDSLVYFVFFALGFGWPLAALPLLAAPVQRTITRFLATHHRPISVLSGTLLVVVAVIGFREDVLPSRSA